MPRHNPPTPRALRSCLALALAAFTALAALTAAPQAAAQTAQDIFSNSPLIPDVGNDGPDFTPGESFRLLFLTSATGNAVPDGIGPYNTRVQNAAANGHADIRRFSAQFRALVSVGINDQEIIDARDNTKTNDRSGSQQTPDPSVPIYWLNGAKVAGSNSDFYDNSWESLAATNEHGNSVANPSEVWTGSRRTGSADWEPGSPVMYGLSIPSPRVGRLSGSGGPIDGAQDIADSTLLPLYAVSPVLNVVAIADTTLSALSFEGTSVFTPAFDSATTSYAARVAHDVDSITVTPTTTNSIATATISATHNGAVTLAPTAIASGAGRAIPLSEGLTHISITVSAVTTYTVSVRRVAPPPPAPLAREVLVDTPLASGLGIGEQFRMLFVTSGTRNGAQGDIAMYNTFVQDAAADASGSAEPIAQFSDQFRALVSSAEVDVRDNTATTGDSVPIYWLGSTKVADDYTDFYDGSWDNRNPSDETGTGITVGGRLILTGSTATGFGFPGFTVGSGSVRLGRLDQGNRGGEINFFESGKSNVLYHLYALSPVLTVVTDAPVVETPIPDQTATARALFSYTFPPNTFYDFNNALLSYSVTGLPSWLTFQPADVAAASRPRTLRGTPPSSAVEQSPFTITVTASDGDQATADVSDTFTLTVSSALEFDTRYIPLPAASYTFTIGVAISPLRQLPLARGGLAPLTYTLRPTDDLPDGITYNPSTRILSGAPTETAEPVALTYAVTDANLSVITLTFSLGVVASPTLDSIADQVYTINQPVDFTLPEATGGAAMLTYTLVRTNGSPRLPPGLDFDPAARTISGATTYTFGGVPGAALRYTATDANGGAAAQDFTLRAVAAPVFPDSAVIADQMYTAGVTIPSLTLPEATGAATPLTYSLSPAASVPFGLTLNPTTRVLSGAPAFAVTNAALTYIVTDINGATDTLSFNLTVAATFGFDITAIPAPDAAYQYIVNQPITPLTLPPVTGGTGTLTYALDGVPAGLTFSAGARTLSGAPAAAVDDAALTYTVTDSAASPNSVALTFMVSAASQPTVTSVTAVAGTPDDLYITGEEVNIIIQFSEDVTIAGTPQLALDTGNSDGNGGTAEYVSASNPVTAIFSYTVRAGDNTAALAYTGTDALDLNGGTIRNTANTVDADLTLPTVGSLNSLSGSAAVTLDTTAPVFTSGDTANVVVGTALTFTVYDAEATNNGGAADDGVTYSLSGTDAGLFDIVPATGEVTYIAVQNDVATHRIVVTAINMLGNPTTQIVDISVLPPPAPDITDSALSEYTNGVTTFTFTWGEMVNDFVAGDITVDGGTPGTFTETTAGMVYTLVVTPNANINDGTITVTVDANVVTGALTKTGNDRTIATQKFDTVAPVFAADTDTVNFAVNTPSGTEVYNAAATDGDVADRYITYSLGGTDAAQFAIGVNNGKVTLTSPSMADHTFVVTATDKGGNTDTITVTVSSALAFYTRYIPVPTAPYIYTVDVPIPPLNFLLPPVRGGLAPLTYTLHPADALPEGLTFNTFTRILSGTPTETATPVALTYTVTNANPSVATLTFSLGVAASPTLESIADQVYTIQPVDFTLPEATGGAAPLSYTLMRIDGGSPVLPPGLDFDPAARTISGMPTVAFGGVNGATLRYTATDANGAAVALTFMVSAEDTVVPVFTTDRAQITVATGTTPATTVHDANATDNGRGADIGITYTLAGTDAATFTLNTDTGELAPVSDLPATVTTYSVDITATDEVGNEATQYLTIVVSDIPTVNISSNVGLTNTATIADGALTFTFSWSEAVPGFGDADSDITVTGGGTKGAFTGTGGVYTLVVTPLANTNDGVLTITVAEGVATGGTTGRGNLAASKTQAYDTQAPTMPSIATPIATDNVINAAERTATVTVTGITGVIGSDTATITLCAGATSATTATSVTCTGTPFTATPDAGTTWSYTLTTDDIRAFDEGGETLTAIAKDAAGNTAVSAGRAIKVDTMAPSTPDINPVDTDNIIDVSNTLGNAEVLFSGITDINTDVTICFGGSDDACTGGTKREAKQGGISWFYMLPNSDLDVLGQGDVTVRVIATDAAGNPSPAVTRDIFVDTVPPTAPTIATVATNNIIDADNIINAEEQAAGVTLSGTTDAETRVTLCFGGDDDACTGGRNGNAAVSSTVWTYTLVTADYDAMGQGLVTLRATATDAVGNPATGTRVITVDTIPPAFVRASESTNRAQVAAAIGADTDTIVHDAVANDNNRAYDTGIDYTLDATAADTFDIDMAKGVLTPKATLTEAATYSVDITATDDAGNEATQYLAIVVSDLPFVTISSNVGITNTATIADDVLTFTFSWSEAVTDFATDDIAVSGGTFGSVMTIAAGLTYTLEVTPTPNINNGLITVNVGANAVTATATGRTTLANPPTTATQAYDTQAPAEPSIGDVATDNIINFAEANDDAGVAVTGVIGSDTSTVTLCAGATSVIDPECAGGMSFTAAAATTTWSYPLTTADITALGGGVLTFEGVLTFTAIATDAAGNTAVSAGQPITVDTVVPAAPVFASGPLEINILFRQTNTNVLLVGTTDPGTTVTICFGGSDAACAGGRPREADIQPSGMDWLYTMLRADHDAIGQGDVTLLATATDAAGNTSAVGTSDIITVDLTAPVFTSGGTVSVAVDAATTFTVYDADATDNGGDADDGVTYSLSGTDAGLFDIDSANGAVTYLTPPPAAATHRITVTATDTVDNRTTRNVTISVLAAPEPEITDSALSEYTNGVTTFTFTWNEMVSGFGDADSDITVDGGTAGTFTGTDPGMVYTLVVTPPTAPTNDGVLTVTVAANAVTGALTKTGNEVKIATQKFDTVAPVFTSGDTATFAVNTPINTAVYTAAATDGGGAADDDITYSLSGAVGRFSIYDGEVVYVHRPSIGTTDTFTVTATDRGGNTDTITVTTVAVDPDSIDLAQQTQIVPADWALIPDQDGVTGRDFGPGESFRLLFTTAGVSDATSSVIADYNAFVQEDASLATGIGMPIRPFSAKFRALISTPAVDARDNTATYNTGIDAPIYWLGNKKVADDYTDFYDGTWDASSGSDFRNRNGDETPSTGALGVVVWTGTNQNGTRAVGFEAGQSQTVAGQVAGPASLDGTTLRTTPGGFETLDSSFEYYLYALSPVFIVQPDTALSKLRITPSGGLTPVFDTAVFTYTATAPAETTTVTVAAMATDTNADIQYAVGDPSTATFTDSSTLTVVDGNNVLTVRVIAGSTSQDYTIMLNVGAIDQVPPTVESVTYFSDEAATTTIAEALINTNVYVVVQFSENVENRVTVRAPNPSDIVAGQPVLLVRTQSNFPGPPVADSRFEIIAHDTPSFDERATQCRAESATDTSRYLCQTHLTPATLRAGPVNIRVLAQGPPVGSGVRPFTQDLAGNQLAGDGVNEGTDYTDSPGINAIVPDPPTVDSVTHYPTVARTAEISGPVVSGDIYSIIQFTGAAISFNVVEPVQTPPDARPQIFYQIGTEMRMQFGVTARTGVPAAGTCRLFTGIEQDSENSKFWCRYATKRGDTGLYKIIVGTETRDVNGEHLAAEYTGDTGVTLAVVAGDAALTMADVNGMADVSVLEGDGSASITVTLDTAVTSGFTVDVSTMDGLAVAPGDYTALTDHTLTFAGTANETQTFSVTIIDDDITENEQGEPLTLALGNIVLPPGITTEIAIDTATLTITDNDTSALTIERNVSVGEGAGAAVVSVQLDKALYTGFTVRVATADDSAVAPGDYTAITAHTLTFAGNADETQTFSVTISDDNIAELDETLTVSLNVPVFNSIDGIHRDGISRLNVSDTATITIVDNELTFSVATIDDQDWVVGTAVNLTLPAATGGNGTLSYTLTPPAAIPDGLTFNPVARTLDGTPTAVTPAATLTYTATDSDSTAPVAPIALTFSVAVRAAGTDAMLSALTVTPSGATDALTFTQSDGTTTGFATAELTYTATARVGTTTVAVVATTNDGAATYTINGTAADGNTALGVTRTTTGGAVTGLTAGENTITVTVTAADGTTMRDYTITLTVQEPIVLTGLPSGADLTLEYGAAASEFGLTLNPVSAREITTITATSNGVVTAEVLDNGSYNSGGEGRYVLSVTPPDTGTTYTDTVTITATAVGHTTFTQDISFTIVDATLSALSVTPSGGGETLTLTPTFAAATTFIAYTATARVGTTTVAVTATTNDGAATYTITGTAADGNTDLGVTRTTTGGDVSGLTAGDNVITVTVTAENGTTMRVYTITLTVRATASTDATLNALTVTPIGGSAVTLTPVFDATTYTYTATASSTTTTVTVAAPANDSNATVAIAGTNAGGTALGINGGDVSGLTAGDNVITVTVTAEDTTTTRTYTITLTVRATASTDATLDALTVTPSGGSAVTLTPVFDAATYTYTATAPSATTTVTVAAPANDSNATVAIAGTAADGSTDLGINGGVVSGLTAGDNVITVTVTAEDTTTTRVYTITLTVPASTDATLRTLTVTPSGGSAVTLTPVFDAATYTYTATAPSATTTVTVAAPANDSNATVAIAGTAADGSTDLGINGGVVSGLTAGDNVITVTVTAEDTTTTRVYTITLTVPASTDATLRTLTVTPSGGSALTLTQSDGTTTGFATGQFTYTATAQAGTTTVTVAADTTDDGATVDIAVTDAGGTVTVDPATGNVPGLTAGNYVITVTVTAEDGSAMQAYTITLTVPKPLIFASLMDDQRYSIGEAITVTLPAATGGIGDLTYTLAPLPSGLTFPFGATSRVLSGTPTAIVTQALTYTVTDSAVPQASTALTFLVRIGCEPMVTNSAADIPLDLNCDGTDNDSANDGILTFPDNHGVTQVHIGVPPQSAIDSPPGDTVFGLTTDIALIFTPPQMSLPSDATVCLPTDPTRSRPSLYHDTSGGTGPATWTVIGTDTTTSPGYVCGTTRTFSPFAVGYAPAGMTASARLATISHTILPEMARAITDTTVHAITQRLDQAMASAGDVTTIKEIPGRPRRAGAFTLGGQTTLADMLRTGGQALADGTLDLRDTLGRSAFVLPIHAGGGRARHLTLWGNGAYRALGGDGGATTWDGTLFSARMGADALVRDNLLAGAAISWTQGDVAYGALTDDPDDGGGDYDMEMTTVHPYLNWRVDPAGDLNLWATAGYGWGDVTLTDTVVETPQTSEATLTMVGGGVSGLVMKTGNSQLRLKGELMQTHLSLDGSEALAALTVEARRMRLSLVSTTTRTWANGRHLTPTVEVGMRHDAGDGRTGIGAEVGGGVRYAFPAQGFTVESRSRVLLGHTGDYKDWGVGGVMSLEPGQGGQGLAFRLAPTYGQTETQTAQVWDQGAMDMTGTDAAALGQRLDAEMGYGLAAFDGRSLLTPYGKMMWGRGTREYRLGSRVTLPAGLTMSLEGVRGEPVGAVAAHRLHWQTGWRWLTASVQTSGVERRLSLKAEWQW